MNRIKTLKKLPSVADVIEQAKKNKGNVKAQRHKSIFQKNMGMRSKAFSFIGDLTELSWSIFSNSIYLMFSLGYMYPHLITEVRNYYYSHLKLEGESFRYDGSSDELLVGYLKYFALYLFCFFTSTFLGHFNPISQKASLLFLGFVAFYISPKLMLRGYIYRIRNIVFRGKSFSFDHRGIPEVMKKFYLYLVLSIVSFGVLSPIGYVEIRKTICRYTYYDGVPFKFNGNFIVTALYFAFIGGSFSGLLAIGFALKLPFISLISVPASIFGYMFMQKYFWECTSLGGAVFVEKVPFGEMAIHSLKVSFINYITLGFTSSFLNYYCNIFLFQHLSLKGEIHNHVTKEDIITVEETFYADGTDDGFLDAA